METKVTKIVYNACFGGFGLSGAAMKRYAELKGYTVESEHGYSYVLDETGKRFSDDDIRRDDPILVQVVEELGDEANTRFSELRIRDLPSGTKYRIEEYDGNESVCEFDDYDWRTA
jgi:hypothetical protein